ncbi:glycosyltransferase family 4 protein [Chloroflexota bacterium]
MNILFVLEYYQPYIGGAEIVFKNVCEGLAQRDHRVTVVTSRIINTKSDEVINGVTVHRVALPRAGTRYWFTLFSIPQVLKYARSADIVHTTTYNGAFPAWLASKLLGKKCVITVHEILGQKWRDFPSVNRFTAWLHQFLERKIISLSFEKYVAVSKYAKKSIINLGIDNEKIKVIYNGVDLELFNPKKEQKDKIRQKLNLKNDFVYMYFGRPGISKGVRYLIEAVPLISGRIPNAKLLIILAHEPKMGYAKIKNMISELKIEDRIVLMDPVPRVQLPDFISTSDCVVVPSLTEGFGFTAVEACTMGIPVVASNAGSLPEVIFGKSVLVEPGSPEALAEGVELVYKGEMETTSKKIFYWEDCIEQYLTVYQEVFNDE